MAKFSYNSRSSTLRYRTKFPTLHAHQIPTEMRIGDNAKSATSYRANLSFVRKCKVTVTVLPILETSDMTVPVGCVS